MAATSLLARLGLRIATLGSAASLAIAAPIAEGDVSQAAHTHAARTGFFFPTATSISVATNAVERMRFFDDGGVQIGVGLGWASPGAAKLKVSAIYGDNDLTLRSPTLPGIANFQVQYANIDLISTYHVILRTNSSKIQFENADGFWPETSLKLGRTDFRWASLWTKDATISASAAAAVPLWVQAFAGQTANLTDWRDSTGGTSLTAIGPNGAITSRLDATFQTVRVGLGASNIATNTVVGFESLNAVTTGYENTVVGYWTGKAITTGFRNTLFGYQAGRVILGGHSNVAIGTYSGWNITNGTYNVSVGPEAGYSVSTGGQNTAIGGSALRANTANGNTAVGFQAAVGVTSGEGNTAVGSNSLTNVATTTFSTAVGTLALQICVGGSNSALGAGAMQVAVSGSLNVAMGFQAGKFIADGVTNNAACNNSVFLGADTKANASGETNQIVIGYGAIGAGSNTCQIGNTSLTLVNTSGAIRSSVTTALITLAPTPLRGSLITSGAVASYQAAAFGEILSTGAVTGSIFGGRFSTNVAAGAVTTNANYTGVYGSVSTDVFTANNLQTASLAGLHGFAQVTPAVEASVTVLTHLAGVQSDVNAVCYNAAGTQTITNAYGFRGIGIALAGNGVGAPLVVTNLYGIYLPAATVGANASVTNHFGVYQADTAARNYFAGLVQMNAAVNLAITRVSGDTTLNATHVTVEVDASGGAVNITLPDSTGANINGRIYNVVKVDASANAVNINRSGADLINGAATVALTVQYQSRTVQARAATPGYSII